MAEMPVRFYKSHGPEFTPGNHFIAFGGKPWDNKLIMPI